MPKNIAHPDPAAVLDTAAKFFRVMLKAGASFSDFTPPMQSVAKRRNLVEYLKLGCPKVRDDATLSTAPSGYDLARQILGDDFITPEEVASARGLVYTDEQTKVLEVGIPSDEVIVWCRRNGYMLIPNPPEAMSFLRVRSINRELFYSKEGGWYAYQQFANEDRTEAATWLVIRKGIVPDSASKKWKEQLRLISDVERVPNAAEFSWALTTYKEVRGVYLMNGPIYVRTSSLVSKVRRVFVGSFDSRGFSVNSCWDDSRDGDLGVASARKL